MSRFQLLIFTFVIAISLFGPLAYLLRYSLNEFVPAKKMMVEALTLANYVKFFTDPYYTSILLTTVRISLLVTVACLVLGFPLAYVVARTQSRWKHLLIISIILQLFVGNSVRALQRQAGRFTRLLTETAPDQLVDDLANAAADGKIRLPEFHIFPFGGLRTAARWIRSRSQYSVVSNQNRVV